MKNLPHVFRYLQGSGWKISLTQLYQHHRQGKIVPETDGSYKKENVDCYAKKHLKQYTGMLSPVLRYLQGSGWKISRTKLYRHRGEGKIVSETDGSYKKENVDCYAKKHLKQYTGKLSPLLHSLKEAGWNISKASFYRHHKEGKIANLYALLKREDIDQEEEKEIIKFGWGPDIIEKHHTGPRRLCCCCHRVLREHYKIANICKECESKRYKESVASIDDRYIKRRLRCLGISNKKITPGVRQQVRDFVLLEREIKTTKQEVRDGITRAGD